MIGNRTKLVTLICESSLEKKLSGEILKTGAKGYTVTDARGRGSRGVRDALWGASSNIRFDVLCSDEIAMSIVRMIEQSYSDDYGIVLYVTDVEVRRSHKF